MCGIAGVRRYGATPITHSEITLLLCGLEHRGRDATGMAVLTDGQIHILKAPVPAWQFTKTDAYKNFLLNHVTERTEIVLLHDRWASVGDAEDNANNHPMWDGTTAVVHNGGITNYEQIFTEGKYDKSCKTDSDVFRAIVDKHGMHEKGIREMCKCAGSAAIAAISMKYPGELLLARSGSPLVYGFTPDESKMYWASEPGIMIKAAKPFYNVRGVIVQDVKSNLLVGSMPNNSAWLFGPEAFILHHEFDTCAVYRQPDYGRTSGNNYNARQRGWRKKGKKVNEVVLEALTSINNQSLKGALVKCAGCGTPNRINDDMPLKKLRCAHCKAKLG